MYKLFVAIAYRKILFIFVAFIVFLFVAAFSLLKPVMYKATAVVQLIPKEETSFHLPSDNSGVKFNEASFYKTQYKILESRVLALRVLDKILKIDKKKIEKKTGVKKIVDYLSLDEYFSPNTLNKLSHAYEEMEKRLFSDFLLLNISDMSPKERETLLLAFQKQLKVLPVVNSQLVYVVFTSADKQLAADVTNIFIDEYSKLSREAYNEKIIKIKSNVLDNINKIRKKISKIEINIQEYTSKKDLIITKNESNPYITNVSALDQAFLSSKLDQLSAKSSLDAALRGGGASTAGILGNSLVQKIKAQKAELYGEYYKKLKIYKPAYPQMQQLKKRIEELDKAINVELTHLKNNLLMNYRSVESRGVGIRSLLEKSKMKYQAYLKDIVTYNELKRDLDIEEALYGSFLRRLKEVDVTAGAEFDNVYILEKASVPQFSYSPNYVIAFSMGGVIALLLGISVVGIVDSRDGRIKTLADVQKIKTTNLAFVEKFKFNRFGSKKHKRQQVQSVLSKFKSIDHNNQLKVISTLSLRKNKKHTLFYLSLIDLFLKKNLNVMVLALETDYLLLEKAYKLKTTEAIRCSESLSVKVSNTNNLSISLLEANAFFPLVGEGKGEAYIEELGADFDVVLLVMSEIEAHPEVIAYLGCANMTIASVYKRENYLKGLEELISSLGCYAKAKYVILYGGC